MPRGRPAVTLAPNHPDGWSLSPKTPIIAGHGLRAAPCGRRCVLRPDVYHEFCSCGRVDCQECHGSQRFQKRGAK